MEIKLSDGIWREFFTLCCNHLLVLWNLFLWKWSNTIINLGENWDFFGKLFSFCCLVCYSFFTDLICLYNKGIISYKIRQLVCSVQEVSLSYCWIPKTQIWFNNGPMGEPTVDNSGQLLVLTFIILFIKRDQVVRTSLLLT